jgi:hypothetical protein
MGPDTESHTAQKFGVETRPDDPWLVWRPENQPLASSLRVRTFVFYKKFPPRNLGASLHGRPT